jgi:hypothetical protein
MKTEMCLFMTVLLVKGQIKPKAGLARCRFSQKRTSEFVLIAVKSKIANKTNSFVCLFFGRIYNAPICFWFYLTFMLAGFQSSKFLLCATETVL